ncbi:glycoprotein [Lone star tick rhabdovirus]|uniref:Glycoprotein n=1 Tax=Lone star tick rhabdovirus TaxID=1756186 RepID=A0A1N7TF64_9RHAB|nr:glycoprotein [Lone star tick rhabdovirus]ALO28654.1 glycoprotein [Lone star tick rhabdovirus]
MIRIQPGLAILIVFTISPILSSRHSVIMFPHVVTPWIRAKTSDLSCPPSSPLETPNALPITEIDVFIQKDHKELELIPGLLCYGLKYVTHCSEGFFGQKTISKRIDKIAPTLTDCRKSYEIYEKGEQIDPYFPASKCTWMAEDEDSKNFYLLTPHSVKYDPYTTGATDPLFLRDHCKETTCETVHANTIWMTTKSINRCSPFQRHVGTLYHDPRKNVTHIQYKGTHTYSLNGSCLMNYCDKFGVRLSNGLFLGGPLATKIPNGPKCPQGTTVKFVPIEDEIETLEEEIQEDRDRETCLVQLMTVRMSNFSTFFSLSYMDPKFESRGKVFRIHQNHLEMAHADWIPVTNVTNHKQNLIGISNRGKELYFTDWVPSGRHNLSSGWNGVHKTSKGKIIIPRLSLLKQEYEETLLVEHNLREITPVHIHHFDKEGLNDTVVTLTSHELVDVGAWIGSVWSTLWGKITTIVTVIIALIILYFIVRCCVPILSRCCKKKESKHPEFEMVPLRSPSSTPSRVTLTRPKGWQ